MSFRLSRLRFILIRSCIISCIIILYLQIVEYYHNDNNSSNEYNELLTFEQRFWKKISLEDKHLSDIQRIKQIKSIENQLEKNELNWTKIFLDNYQRKLKKLDERNSKTTLKSHFKDNQQNISQEIFQIYEETPVNYIKFIFLKNFYYCFRYLENQNFVHQNVYFILNVHIQIVNGVVKNHQVIIKIFVVLVFFTILI